MTTNWPRATHRSAMAQSPHPYTASTTLSLYANPEEVEAAIAALKNLWSDYGREMKQATTKAASLVRRPDESAPDYIHRYYAMNEQDQCIAITPENFRYRRREIYDDIKRLRDNKVPWRRS